MRGLILAVLLFAAPAGLAETKRAGEFDYYILALSWSPGWCDREGRARGSEQCDPGRRLGWSLHGLWPQYEKGWPEFCNSTARDPSRGRTTQMADIMGTGGLAWYQWKKHGRCTGLSADDYFDAARRAYDAVTLPEVFKKLRKDVRLSAAVVEEAFLQANPQLSADMITITCEDGDIQEARICLTRGLSPRVCAPDARRDCTARSADMPAPR